MQLCIRVATKLMLRVLRQEKRSIVSYHLCNYGTIQDASLWSEQDIYHVRIVFHSEMKELHDGIDAEVILLTSLSVGNVVFLPYIKSLVL